MEDTGSGGHGLALVPGCLLTGDSLSLLRPAHSYTPGGSFSLHSLFVPPEHSSSSALGCSCSPFRSQLTHSSEGPSRTILSPVDAPAHTHTCSNLLFTSLPYFLHLTSFCVKFYHLVPLFLSPPQGFLESRLLCHVRTLRCSGNMVG